jgi:hypothetical protein
MVVEGEQGYQSETKPPDKPKIIVSGSERELMKKWPSVGLVVGELLKNCEEKPGVKQITVNINGRTVTIEDDIVYDEPTEIINNLNHPKPQSRKDVRDRTVKGTPRGAGIRWCRHVLETDYGGSLVYQTTDDNRIKAVINW